MNIDAALVIQLYGKTFDEGLRVLYEFFGQLMRETSRDMFFLENGTDQMFRKEGDNLIINNCLNKYQKQYFTQELLNLLNHAYVEMNLSISQ